MAPRSYRLGIDLGTTYTAAVVCRRQSGDGDWGEPEIVALGTQSASVASVLYLGEDGSVLVGEAAERRALTEPGAVVRQFKRRIGDDVPLVVGNSVHTAHDLAARMGRWVVDKVAEREGGPAEAVAVTHPAAWGRHKKELLAGALRQVGLDGVTFLPEPQAAAVAYSSRERVDTGGAVAVYDLGGGTFDAAVVRRTADAFDLPGRAEGIEQLGGVDFDERVFDHVRAGLGAALDELDIEDPDVVAAVLRLRRECVEAKEALSFDTQATIPVMLPGIRTNVRITRVEFEAAIRSSIDHTVDALRRSVESAALSPDDLQAVLLVGGSSRIPLVAQMISAELGRPVAVDSDPKTSIAMGAALTIAPRPVASAPARPGPPPPPAVPEPPESGSVPSYPAPTAAAPAARPPQPEAPQPQAPQRQDPQPQDPRRQDPRSAPVPIPAPAAVASRTPTSDSSSGVLDLRAYATPPAPARAPDPVRHPGPSPAAGPTSRPSPAAPPPYARYPAGPEQGPPPGYPGRPPMPPPQQDDGEGSGAMRTVVIVVLAALLLFGVALGIGAWVKAQRQSSAPTTSSMSAPAPHPTALNWSAL